MGLLRMLNALFRRSKISTQTVETPPSGSNFRYANHEAIDEKRGIRIRPVHKLTDSFEDGRTYRFEEGSLICDFCMEATYEDRELVFKGVPRMGKVQIASLIVESTMRPNRRLSSGEYEELKTKLKEGVSVMTYSADGKPAGQHEVMFVDSWKDVPNYSRFLIEQMARSHKKP